MCPSGQMHMVPLAFIVKPIGPREVEQFAVDLLKIPRVIQVKLLKQHFSFGRCFLNLALNLFGKAIKPHVIKDFEPIHLEVVVADKARRRFPTPFLPHIQLGSKKTDDHILHVLSIFIIGAING